MVHKTDIIPGLSKFLDTAVLSQYPPTSIKRIISAAGIAIYLQQNSNLVDTVVNNPMFSTLHLCDETGMVNIELLRDVIKNEVAKAGFVRIKFPVLGDVDFTVDDIDSLYRCIQSVSAPPSNSQIMNYS
jgi:hypothetical protein